MKFRLILLAVLFLPAVSNAQVLFSEIAWMGTVEDANNEWIEVYNFSSDPTDLTGWTLSDGNALDIPLSGVMPPHGVFVLERTDDSTLPDITADIIYTGALANTGATLTLRDETGAVVNELVGGTDWVNIGGNNELKYTAQSTRTGSWVTGIPTPGLPNIEEDTEIPGSTDDEEDDDDGTVSNPPKTVARSSGGSKNKEKVPNQPLSISINAPTIAYVNQEVSFEAIPTGAGKTTRNSLKYMWNFGDLETATQKSPTHSFEYPGEYLVVVEAEFAKQLAQQRHEIKVLPVALRIIETENGDALLINESSHEVNLENFKFKGNKTFTFPRLSILKAGGTLTIPKEKFGNSSYMTLYDVENTQVVSNIPAQKPAVLGASYVAPKVSYTKPATVAVKQTPTADPVSDEEVGQAVIKIGEKVDVPQSGFFARLFGRIGSLFRM